MIENLKPTVDVEAYNKLFNKKAFERLTIYTPQILNILKQEQENKELYKLIADYFKKEERTRLAVADQTNYLDIHIYDPNREIVSVIGVGTNKDDLTTELVSKDTYENLKNLATDIDSIKVNVKRELSNAV